MTIRTRVGKQATGMANKLKFGIIDKYQQDENENKITTKYKKNKEFDKYLILVEFEKIEQSIEISESLEKNPYVSQLVPKEISKKKIFYELFTHGSIEKLKLALKSSNLDLKFDEKLEILKVVKSK